jgi:hypothetical protein
MMIIMEELTEDSSIEDMYYELNDMWKSKGLPIQYLDNLDTDEYEISKN